VTLSLKEQDIEYLKTIVGDENIRLDEIDRYLYSYDVTPVTKSPDVIIKPHTTEEIAQIIKYANEHRIPITPRGAGSGTAGGAVPLHGGIVLLLTGLNRIKEINVQDLAVVTETGVVHNDLNEELAKYGFFFPPDPGSKRMCTIGGEVAIGGSGVRAVKYGVTRNYVLGLKAVLPNGEIIELGGKYLKHATGISLLHLLIGSEGTLGIITEVTLKILPLPERKAVITAAFQDLHDCSKALLSIYQGGIIPAAVELLDRSMIQGLNEFKPELGLPDVEGMLFIEVDGSVQETRRSAEKIANFCREAGGVKVDWSDDPERCEILWEARSMAGGSVARTTEHLSRVYLGAEDVIVPISKIPDLLLGIRAISEKTGVPIYVYGHFGEGNLHPGMAIDKGDERDWENLSHAVKEVYELTFNLGGTISGEHGMGCTRNEYMERVNSKAGMEAIKKIKNVLDPNNIMNPGKLGLSGSL